MKKVKLHSRRHFMTLGSEVVLGLSLMRFVNDYAQAGIKWKISLNRKSVGIMISKDSGGMLILSAREINGKKLFIIPLGVPKSSNTRSYVSKRVSPRDGSPFTVKLASNGKISLNVEGIKAGAPLYVPKGNSQINAQNFWNWLKDLASDVAAGIAVGILYLRGQFAVVDFSDGSTIMVWGDGTIIYEGAGGFKLEPGMEDDNGVWY